MRKQGVRAAAGAPSQSEGRVDCPLRGRIGRREWYLPGKEGWEGIRQGHVEDAGAGVQVRETPGNFDGKLKGLRGGGGTNR